MTIFTEIINFLQNHSDGQQVVENSNLSASEFQRVAEEIIPQFAAKFRQNPRSLEDLMRIIEENKDDPQSLLNSNPGFDHRQAQNEGRQILQAIFGGGNKSAKVADDVSQKTGVDVVDISAMMPIIATMATKLLSGKLDAAQGRENGNENQNMVNEVLSFLDMNKDGSISDDVVRIVGSLFK